jgi:hypothetical protein
MDCQDTFKHFNSRAQAKVFDHFNFLLQAPTKAIVFLPFPLFQFFL